MMGLEGRLKKLLVLGSLSAGCGPNESDTVSQKDTDSVVETGDTDDYVGNKPYFIENPIPATAYIDQQFSFNIADYVVQDDNGGDLSCRVTAPVNISQNIDESCYFSWTPSATDFGQRYDISLEIEDNYGINNAVLEVDVGQVNSEGIILTPLSPLSGYTNEVLTGSGSFSGEGSTSSITLDSDLEEVVSQTTTSFAGNTVNYSLAFSSAIDWSAYTDGKVEGSAIVAVCDSQNNCDYESLNVIGYAPTEILITAQTADDKEPLSSATISVDCDSGDTYALTPNTYGEATAFLNNSEDICTITSDAGSAYAVYFWQHEIGAGSEDLVNDGYYEVWAETYDNFTPSDTEPEYATCYGGKLNSSRNLLLYANSMFDTVDGADSGRRDFKRFFENEITSPIQYWVSETDNDGNAMSSTMLDAMYSAIVDAANTINTTSPSGTTYLQEATDINDAQIVFYYDDTWTSHGCSYDSSYLVGTYASRDYCKITLHAGYDEARTVMAELFGDLAFLEIDGCDDSITDGGQTPTKNDWFILENTQRGIRDLMERTY